MKFTYKHIIVALFGALTFNCSTSAGNFGLLFKHTLLKTPSLHIRRNVPQSLETPHVQFFVRHYSIGAGRFLDPKNDIAFKKLFGTEEHKPLLMSFLNSLLRLKGERAIRNVELLPTEQIPRIQEAKRAILDVKCTDNRNIQYIVEMQNRRAPNFLKRSQFYAANAYADQLSEGENYLKLKPVVLLAIADHTLFPNKKNEYISFHKTLDTKTQEHDLEDLSYAFVELPKFNKTDKELTTTEDKWLYMFKHFDTMQDIPPEIPQEIQEAYKTLEKARWSRAEKEAYFKTCLALADEFDALRGEREKGEAKGKAEGLVEGEAKGLAKGLAEGEVKGKAEEKKAMARNMLAAQMAVDVISQVTGLSVEDIRGLSQS